MDERIRNVAEHFITARDLARRNADEQSGLPTAAAYLRGRADAFDLTLAALAGLELYGSRESFEATVLLRRACPICGHHDSHAAPLEGCEACNVAADHGQYAPCAIAAPATVGAWEPRS